MDRYKRKFPPELIQYFVETVEKVRVRRREHFGYGAHPHGKRFSQEELYFIVPSYKNLLIGRTQQLITCEEILQIADHLECTPTERNELLLAAQYSTDPILLHPDTFHAALDHGRIILESLPLPATLVSYGWTREAINEPFLQLYQQPLDQPDDTLRMAIPWAFDSASPAHDWFAPDAETWQANSQSIVQMFKHMHRAFEHESYYQQLLHLYQRLPDFAFAWAQVKEIDVEASPHFGLMRLKMPWFSTPIQEQHLTMPLSFGPFPLIILTVPVDKAARIAYENQGLPVGRSLTY